MINYHLELVGALEGILPTYQEMQLTSGTATPCISYMEKNNYVSSSGDTLGYSVLTYQVKVWSTKIADLQKEMGKAVEEQNFERAAIIRDEIKKLKGEN